MRCFVRPASLLVVVLLSACPSANEPAPYDASGDVAARDTGRDVSRAEDVSSPDTGPRDAADGPDAAPDVGAPDASEVDAGAGDAGAGDASAGDASACRWAALEPISDSPLEPNPGRHETTRADGFDDEYLLDPTGAFKVGIRRDWGGSIVFFGSAGAGAGANLTNTIDANDTGREVQVALYDPDRRMQECAWDASCLSGATACPNSITYLGWNPVQGGNRCNNGSDVGSFTGSSERISMSTIPKQWNPNWQEMTCETGGCGDPALSVLDSDVRLEQHLAWVGPRVVELRYTVENLAAIDHAATVQEMPTMYTATGQGGPDLWRLFEAGGAEITIDTPANDGFFREDFTSTAPWVTMQNTALDYGVGILYENGVTDFQGWQNRALPFNNVRARFAFGLPANGVVHARAYLMLGSKDTITADANALLGDLPPFGVIDTPAPGQAATGATTLSGWVLDNRGVASVWAVVDETTRVDMTHGRARADVCTAWPGYPGCPNVGWGGTIDLPTDACAHKVEVFATDTDGNTRLIAHRLVRSL